MPVGKGDEAVRRMVMDEVTKQLGPTLTLLQKLSDTVNKSHDWQLSFWSNGNRDRPPGFFQTRMKDDDRRYLELVSDMTQLKDHKKQVETLITESRAARKMREEQEAKTRAWRQFWLLKIGLPILLLLLSGIGVAVKQSFPVVRILWKDYLRAHPLAASQLKTVSSNGPTVAEDAPADATNSPAYADTNRR